MFWVADCACVETKDRAICARAGTHADRRSTSPSRAVDRAGLCMARSRGDSRIHRRRDLHERFRRLRSRAVHGGCRCRGRGSGAKSFDCTRLGGRRGRIHRGACGCRRGWRERLAWWWLRSRGHCFGRGRHRRSLRRSRPVERGKKSLTGGRGAPNCRSARCRRSSAAAAGTDNGPESRGDFVEIRIGRCDPDHEFVDVVVRCA